MAAETPVRQAHDGRSAWLFDFGDDLHAAVGGQHLAEYLRAPQVTEVPLTPAHTRGALVWRKRLVPLIDLARLADNEGSSEKHQEQPQGAIVLAYRETPHAPLQYGALVLASVPREIGVRDDMACDLPTAPTFWGALAASCITHENRPVPILRVRHLFTQALAVADAPVRATRAPEMETAVVAVTTAAPLIAPIEPAGTREAHTLTLVATRPDEIQHEAIVAAAPTAPASLREDAPAVAAFAEISRPLVEPRVTFAAPAGVAASRAQRQKISNTVLSFQHLHAIARQYKNPRWILTGGDRWLRRVLVVVALAMLVLAWNLSMDSGESPPKLVADAPQPVAKDIAPDGIAPGFKPSAPAQPPK